MNKTAFRGLENVRNLNLVVCSIVRDCDGNLKKNIPIINSLVSNFKSSSIIIYENDSKDNTKKILHNWSKESSNVIIECNDFGSSTIPKVGETKANRYFSRLRINKMVEFRNNYLNKISELNFQPDYVLIVDLDVSKIFLNGIFHSFGLMEKWDVVSANGYSLSPKLKRRYHDSYALVEIGNENVPQTEDSIFIVSDKFSSLNKDDSLIPVYSAYGGLSIYRYEALKNLRYRLIDNEDERVEVRCEHFALCHDIRQNGFRRIFINPSMTLIYQSLSWNLIINFLKRLGAK